MVECQTQSESGGSNPTSPLHFSRCSLSEVSRFVKEHHYSKSHPGGIDYSFKLDFKGSLGGACLFGYMAGNPKASCVLRGHDDPRKYRELMRLVLLDEVPRNSESRFVGWCLRYLTKNTDLLATISFADPKFGHSGGIYRAGNWLYTGLQKPARPRLIIDGKEVHPKSAYNRFGTSSTSKIMALGYTLELTPREPKHRYIYLLRKGFGELLKYDVKKWEATSEVS